ncbi:MAG TPA: ECF transporter S component [Pseudolysinimonas sp.]|jgi:energy-coupling factor transport system substrate-specific component|nr:ECF transporter S component [Pseudolysinimonas sp.]
MTSATLSKPSYRWRVVDIVVAAVVAVACAVVFVGWNIGSHVLDGLGAALPGLQAIGYGPWLIGGPLAALIIRKPGAALFGELVAAAVSMLLGAPWGLQTLESGLVQGLAVEVVFAVFAYRVWSWPVAALSGAAAGVVAGVNDWIFWYPGADALFLTIYIVCAGISGAVIAGIGSWALVKALAQTGALSRFPSGREAARV